MYVPALIYAMSDTEILEHIGKKIKAARLNNNVTREQLQERSGIHKKTIGDLENGKNVTLQTLIAVLRGMKRLNLLDGMLEDEEISPILITDPEGNAPKRASKRRQ
ncbi:MAG: helix-turn-helix domain-containing protein [Candidatus Methanoplasma sp.]|jgi:transcriptional regulator with XRE-family HTH domain|nr:helix-turn-helix domain-containing protein [Candidatus Methanoplasma sp.]